LFNWTEGDNVGEACADVYAKFKQNPTLKPLVPTEEPTTTNVVWSTGYTGQTWYDQQCKNIGGGKASLDQCKSMCEQKDGCNAINHKNNACVLRKCPLPIPQPLLNKGGHVGYVGYEMQELAWSTGYKGQTWYDDQCKNLQNTKGSLDQCKSACAQKYSCNAINHKNNACVLRKCPTPIPVPRDNKGGHIGYTGYKAEVRPLVESDC